MSEEPEGAMATRFVVHRLGTVDSTNRWMLDQARAGAPARTVAVADVQTAGRGRLGRRWDAPPGSALLVSVLVRPVVGPEHLWLYPGAVALAARHACAELAGVAAGCKWPNDLVVDDVKLAGILAEGDHRVPARDPDRRREPALHRRARAPALVVGLGLNVTGDGPPGVEATSVQRAGGGVAIERDDLLEALLAALAPALDDLDDPDDAAGRRRLAGDLRRASATLGRAVRVELDGEVLTGTALRLTDEGHLVVAPAGGGAPRELASGDVVHLRVGGEPAGPVG